jgi:uncharacterized protein
VLLSHDLQRDAPERHLRALLALNNAHAVETSWLDGARLAELVHAAFQATAIGRDAALLIAFDQDAPYDSPNFVWFKQRFERFVYVDRIIVSEAYRGRGLARRLYDEVFQSAIAAGHSKVVCEVNVDPPNPASDAFHEALGFDEIGRDRLSNGKTVRYLARTL